MKLLVARTWHVARTAIDELGLPGEWMPTGYGGALAGHQFDKIVILLAPTYLSDREIEAFDQWVDNTLRCRLRPGCEDDLVVI